MADHVSEQIVQAATTLVKNGGTDAGVHVFDSKFYAFQDDEVPGVGVDIDGDVTDEVLEMGHAGRAIQRTMDLVFTLKVKQNATARTALLSLRKQIEVLIGNNNTFGNLAKWAHPIRFTMEKSGDAEHPAASGELVFGVTYITPLNAPDTPL